MKKNLLISILMIFINHLIAYQPSTRLILTEKESQILAYLQDSYIKDELFYKSFSDDDLTYSLDILSRKIESLNKEALPENSKKMKSYLIALGLIPLSVAICLVAPAGKKLYTLYTQFKSGKFKDIHLPLSIIKELPSKMISKKEKRYLKRFSFEELYIDYIEDPFESMPLFDFATGNIISISQEQKIQNTIANLPLVEKEKLKYIALCSAITSLNGRMLGTACFILTVLTIGAIYSIILFDGIFDYDTKIQEEIKLNKELYSLLKKEQERYQ